MTEKENSKPTAAAAVPAGGDAINPSFWIDALRTSIYCTDCDQKRQVQTNAVNNLERYIEGLRAPRGVVTEAVGKLRIGTTTNPAFNGHMRIEIQCTPAQRAMLEADAADYDDCPLYLSPPAAQAQDAGPKVEHWRAAFEIWAGNRTAMGEFDRIEQRARALAAKEAE